MPGWLTNGMFRHCILHASGCTAHAEEAAEFKAVDRAWGGSVRLSAQVVPGKFDALESKSVLAAETTKERTTTTDACLGN